jgi:hypothetical protein
VGERATRLAPGTTVRATLDRAGTVESLPDGVVAADRRATVAAYADETGHNIAAAFWEFVNARGPVYTGGRVQEGRVAEWVPTFGYPITEPYWTQIRVGGRETWVLFQAFERRVLTFNPANPPAFQVEVGNVGRHYYAWRYAPVPACLVGPAQGFGTVWSRYPLVAASLGCSADAATTVHTSIQHFEHGMMLELHPDSGDAWGIYALFEDGTFLRYNDTWTAGDPETHRLTPPPGRYEPVRGFNKVWFDPRKPVRARLGWGLDKEVGGPGARQRFANGAMFWVRPTDQILVLHETAPYAGRIARWQLFDDLYNAP